MKLEATVFFLGLIYGLVVWGGASRPVWRGAGWSGALEVVRCGPTLESRGGGGWGETTHELCGGGMPPCPLEAVCSGGE